MSNSVTVKLNSSGVREFLREDTREMLNSRAKEIAERCGSGYTTTGAKYMGSRSVASVIITDNEAYFKDLKTNRLIKNLY